MTQNKSLGWHTYHQIKCLSKLTLLESFLMQAQSIFLCCLPVFIFVVKLCHSLCSALYFTWCSKPGFLDAGGLKRLAYKLAKVTDCAARMLSCCLIDYLSFTKECRTPFLRALLFVLTDTHCEDTMTAGYDTLPNENLEA
jgi:hypothetical protein